MKTSTLQIKTPEGIVFAQTLASPLVRFVAWVIDLVCVAVLLNLARILVAVSAVVSTDLATAVDTILFFAVSIGYGMFFEWLWRGQTIGKRVLRLRVIDAQGLRLEFNQIAMRNLLRVLDMLPMFYLVGGVTAFLNRKAQRLGDIAANTVVIRIPRITQPDLEQLASGKFNSLRAHPHLEARLRQRVTPGEAAVALQAVARRNEFEPAARVQLFGELAAHFKAKVDFPPEAIDGIADEQYVRNVVDVLYRADRKAAEKAVPA